MMAQQDFSASDGPLKKNDCAYQAFGSTPSTIRTGRNQGLFPFNFAKKERKRMTAILIDGGFFRKRAKFLWGEHSPKDTARALFDYSRRHLIERNSKHDLYRIFYYDCPPLAKQMYHPLTGKTLDFSRTEQYAWMNEFLAELKQLRKVALRLGTLDEANSEYSIRFDVLKKLCRGDIAVSDLKKSDFLPNIKQKGVDMKIGVDIASLAYKRQVSQIVLIAGDSDFVPAAKLARREGIDFVLDPMGAPIKDSLFEHIDGKRSCGDPFKGRAPSDT